MCVAAFWALLSITNLYLARSVQTPNSFYALFLWIAQNFICFHNQSLSKTLDGHLPQCPPIKQVDQPFHTNHLFSQHVSSTVNFCHVRTRLKRFFYLFILKWKQSFFYIEMRLKYRLLSLVCINNVRIAPSTVHVWVKLTSLFANFMSN